jgi:WD40 repeat protein
MYSNISTRTGFNSFCLLPESILVCGLYDGTITKWNLNNFTKIDSFHEDCIRYLKHVSLSQIVSCSTDKEIKLWNLETNQCLKTFIGHTDTVYGLEISFDKSKLYSCSLDSTLRVWDLFRDNVCEQSILILVFFASNYFHLIF